MSVEPFLTLFINANMTLTGLCESLDNQRSVSTAPPSYRHITLKTVGRFSGNTALLTDAVETAVADIDPFEISVTGIGTFQNHIYLPVNDPDNSLRKLHEAICHVPLFDDRAYEGDDYIPHITVAKTDSPPPEAVLEPYTDIEWGTVNVDSVFLVQDNSDSVGPFTTFRTVSECQL